MKTNKILIENQSNLISSYIDIIIDNALEDIKMVDEQYMKDVCMAHIQDSIDFSDVENQIKTECEKITKREMEKFISKISI